jgi:AraC-like DNA-binding protein
LIKARQLLAAGTYTIKEIATQCGFAKTDAFYKAFKRTYGFPPSKFFDKTV